MNPLRLLQTTAQWGFGLALVTAMVLLGQSEFAASAKSVKVVAVPVTSNANIHPIFMDDLENLKKRVKFPVLLPTEFPFEQPPHAILEKATRGKYSLMLAYTAFCSGASSCRYGSVSGELWTANSKSLKGKKIALTQSTLGYFNDGSCKDKEGCKDSTLSWKQGKGIYTVGIKSGRPQDLTSMANSMIQNGSI